MAANLLFPTPTHCGQRRTRDQLRAVGNADSPFWIFSDQVTDVPVAQSEFSGNLSDGIVLLLHTATIADSGPRVYFSSSLIIRGFATECLKTYSVSGKAFQGGGDYVSRSLPNRKIHKSY